MSVYKGSTKVAGNSAVHSHTNKNVIDKFSEVSGAPYYDGSPLSGHVMTPTPRSGMTENNIVTAVNAATAVNDQVTSLFGIQRWSNMKTFRAVCTSGIGHYGIGEWKDYFTTTPTAAQEETWGWWHHNIFTYLGNNDNSGYDVDFDIKFDPGNGEIITLGGYIIDTDTGYMCIKFANYVIDTTNAKVAVDVTFTRNDISIPV